MGAPKTLYINRPLLNADDLIAWAKGQGFATTMPAANIHVTQVYSKTPVDWGEMGEAVDVVTIEGGTRAVMELGHGEADKAAVVLKFDSSELTARWNDLIGRGCKSDYPSFLAHTTFTWSRGLVDLANVEPYSGVLKFGPERFEQITEGWEADLVEKRKQIFKAEVSHGLVFGYAIVCKINGEDYYDLNVDKLADGSFMRVPEHIPEDAMLAASADFMAKSVRPGNDMHEGPDKGEYVFAFPVTTDIAEKLGWTVEKTGLVVGFKPPPDILAKFQSGEYSGFSIQGVHLTDQEVE